MFEILAQDSTPAAPTTPPPQGGIGQLLVSFGPLILILLVFYFLIFSSKRKQDKNKRSMLDNLKKNDRIQSIGGILGTVLQVDGDEVVVKVDETNNTKLRFTRSAIHKVITAETKESK